MTISQIKAILIIVLILSNLQCKNNSIVEQSATKRKRDMSIVGYVSFPDRLYNIDFCDIDLWQVSQKLTKKNSMYSCDGNKCPKTRDEMLRLGIFEIVADQFIGDTIPSQYILSVSYKYYYTYDRIQINIKMRSVCYDRILKLLSDQFEYQKASFDRNNYKELTWYADPHRSKHTCISEITLSRRLQYVEFEKDVFYLTIHTRSKKVIEH